MNALLQYDWPGNVRELENCIERAVALRNHDRLDVADLPSALCNSPPSAIVSEPFASEAPTDLEHLERITIQRVFEQVHGDKMLAGRMLGISRATLYRKLKRYNIGVGASARGCGRNHLVQPLETVFRVSHPGSCSSSFQVGTPLEPIISSMPTAPRSVADIVQYAYRLHSPPVFPVEPGREGDAVKRMDKSP